MQCSLASRRNAPQAEEMGLMNRSKAMWLMRDSEIGSARLRKAQL
jgi:hypothetical protein